MLALAAGIPLVVAPAVQSRGNSGWWTLAQARKYLVSQSPLDLFDVKQADRPEFLVRFTARDGEKLHPLSTARVAHGRRAWQRFEFAGSLFDVERAAQVRVRFVLRADGMLTKVQGPPPNRFQPRFPLRTTFYYEWFPENWTAEGIYPYTKYHPSLGFYSSSDPAVVRRHIAAMLYGRFAVATYDWWGQHTVYDVRLPLVLALSRQTPLRWAIYYEAEGYGDPTVGEIHADLAYLRKRYFSNPAYLKIGGRPVIFAYGSGNDTCSVAERWHAANQGIGAYLVLHQTFSLDFRTCPDQPNAWHAYTGAWYEYPLPPYEFGISPGFDKTGTPEPGNTTKPRDLAHWRQQISDMVASKAPWQLVFTFNEWGEGTAIESANEWQRPRAMAPTWMRCTRFHSDLMSYA